MRHPWAVLLIVVGEWGWCAPWLAGQELTVRTDFEGGSARVLALDAAAGRVRITPGGAANRGWPCWWYLRLEGLAAGQTVTLEVVPASEVMPQGKYAGKPLPPGWAQPQRAHWSADGQQWHPTEPGVSREEGVMAYRLQAVGPQLWVAWGPPQTPRQARAWLERVAERPWAELRTLTHSREGRACLALRLREGALPDRQRLAVWVQARQHAWESGSSWVARGLAEWLAQEHPPAAALRQKSEIWIVPIMDVDNAATGNGGKEALPHDHNRDWTERPVYPEVAAAQQHLLRWAAEERLALFLDLHNPAPTDLRPFFFVCPEDTLTDTGRRNLDRWLTICRLEMNGPLAVSDQPRVSGAAYDPLWKQMSKNWVAACAPPFTVAVTLETAWNTPASTASGYRTLGAQLGQAIERYLRQDPRP